MKKLVRESLIVEKFTDKFGEKHWLKKGLVVKIKSADEIKKYTGLTKDYLNYLLQIAGETVKIERVLRLDIGGPLDNFKVEGIPLYPTGLGFDDMIIDEVISGEEDNKKRQDDRDYQKYLELKQRFEKSVKESLSRINEYDTADENILEGKEEVPVRFYEWEDWERGWGDGGTKFYAILPADAFETEVHERKDGSKWYGFELKREWKQKVGITSGFDGGWHFDFGDEKRKEEIKKAAQMLKLAKEIKRF